MSNIHIKIAQAWTQKLIEQAKMKQGQRSGVFLNENDSQEELKEILEKKFLEMQFNHRMDSRLAFEMIWNVLQRPNHEQTLFWDHWKSMMPSSVFELDNNLQQGACSFSNVSRGLEDQKRLCEGANDQDEDLYDELNSRWFGALRDRKIMLHSIIYNHPALMDTYPKGFIVNGHLFVPVTFFNGVKSKDDWEPTINHIFDQVPQMPDINPQEFLHWCHDYKISSFIDYVEDGESWPLDIMSSYWGGNEDALNLRSELHTATILAARKKMEEHEGVVIRSKQKLRKAIEEAQTLSEIHECVVEGLMTPPADVSLDPVQREIYEKEQQRIEPLRKGLRFAWGKLTFIEEVCGAEYKIDTFKWPAQKVQKAGLNQAKTWALALMDIELAQPHQSMDSMIKKTYKTLNQVKEKVIQEARNEVGYSMCGIKSFIYNPACSWPWKGDRDEWMKLSANFEENLKKSDKEQALHYWDFMMELHPVIEQKKMYEFFAWMKDLQTWKNQYVGHHEINLSPQNKEGLNDHQKREMTQDQMTGYSVFMSNPCQNWEVRDMKNAWRNAMNRIKKELDWNDEVIERFTIKEFHYNTWRFCKKTCDIKIKDITLGSFMPMNKDELEKKEEYGEIHITLPLLKSMIHEYAHFLEYNNKQKEVPDPVFTQWIETIVEHSMNLKEDEKLSFPSDGYGYGANVMNWLESLGWCENDMKLTPNQWRQRIEEANPIQKIKGKESINNDPSEKKSLSESILHTKKITEDYRFKLKALIIRYIIHDVHGSWDKKTALVMDYQNTDQSINKTVMDQLYLIESMGSGDETTALQEWSLNILEILNDLVKSLNQSTSIFYDDEPFLTPLTMDEKKQCEAHVMKYWLKPEEVFARTMDNALSDVEYRLEQDNGIDQDHEKHKDHQKHIKACIKKWAQWIKDEKYTRLSSQDLQKKIEMNKGKTLLRLMK